MDEIKTYEKYPKIMEAHIEKKLTTTIKKVQKEFGVDIFGFGEQLRRQHYKEFKKMWTIGMKNLKKLKLQ